MSNLITVDLIINARWMVPVIPAETVLTDHSVLINKGEIVAIIPSADVESNYALSEDGKHWDLKDHILIPGLINSHGHTPMSLLKGYADDKALKTWLEDHIWPAEGQHVSAQFVEDGTKLSMAEMIKNGTTCFADMYFFPEISAKACESAGMRAQITIPVMDFPTAWASGPEEYFSKGEVVLDTFKDSELVTIGFGPHAPYTVSDGPIKDIVRLAEKWQAPIQIHLHETAFEVEEAIKTLGQRPTERLRDLGLLTPSTQCVHMTEIDDTDIAILQESGAHVVHCPESNLKLASGFCPVDKLQSSGINVALGTDGSASNNDLDMLGEMRTAAMLAKAVSKNAEALSAHKALEMATMNGAKALGISHLVGSLEVGKQADLCAIAMSDLALQPIYHPISQLVYCNNSHNVSHVWVNGKALLADRALQTLDEQEVTASAVRWGETISAGANND